LPPLHDGHTSGSTEIRTEKKRKKKKRKTPPTKQNKQTKSLLSYMFCSPAKIILPAKKTCSNLKAHGNPRQ